MMERSRVPFWRVTLMKLCVTENRVNYLAPNPLFLLYDHHPHALPIPLQPG